MKKKKNRWIIPVAIVVVLAVVAIIAITKLKQAASAFTAAVPDLTVTAELGTIQKTVTASGMLESTDTNSLFVPDGLKVEKVLVKAGDEVREGEPLARLDRDSVQFQLLYVTKALKTLDKKLGTGESEGAIDAPVEGRLKAIFADRGDDVMDVMKEHGCLAILSTDGLMQVRVETTEKLKTGDRYVGKWNDKNRVWATVSEITENGYLFTLQDEKAPYGETITIYDGDRSIGSGILEVHMPVKVFGYAGVVDKIGYKINESVPYNRHLFSLKNSPTKTTFQSKYYERQAVSERLEKLIAFASEPMIKAPCDLVVSESILTDGGLSGKVEKCDKESEAFKYATVSATRLVVSVDEMDIGQLQIGQTAQVTFGAFGDEAFTGTVTRISRLGKKQNSISNYPADVTLQLDERLFAGMNGTAVIMVEERTDVILLPIAAINEDLEGAYVNVLNAAGEKERRAVETGLSDGTMAEIVSGLEAGETVSYSPAGLDINMAAMGMTVATEETTSDGSVVVG